MALTIRQRVADITKLIREERKQEVPDKFKIAGLRNWRESIMTGAPRDPKFARVIFNATMEMYEESINERN